MSPSSSAVNVETMDMARSWRKAGFGAPQLGLAALLLFAPLTARAADLSGTWWIKDRSETAQIDHRTLPFTALGAAEFKQNQADIAAGKGLKVEANKCLPPGTPRLMLARYPLILIQKPREVTLLHEKMRLFRLIFIDKDHEQDPDPSYGGESVAKWDGDTLVVDTIALKSNTVIDKTGIPKSDKSHIVERFSLSDGGATLLDKVTVDDPKIFTRPVAFTIAFAKADKVELMEDDCLYGPPPRDAKSSQ